MFQFLALGSLKSEPHGFRKHSLLLHRGTAFKEHLRAERTEAAVMLHHVTWVSPDRNTFNLLHAGLLIKFWLLQAQKLVIVAKFFATPSPNTAT